MSVIVPVKIVEEEIRLGVRSEGDGTFTVKTKVPGPGEDKIEHFTKRRDLRIRVKEILKAIGIEKKTLPVPTPLESVPEATGHEVPPSGVPLPFDKPRGGKKDAK